MEPTKTLEDVLRRLPVQPPADAAEEAVLLESARGTLAPDLLAGAIALQQERTQLYKDFNGAFEECLSQGPEDFLKSYPPVLLRVRTRLVVIASQVGAIVAVLQERAEIVSKVDKAPRSSEVASLLEAGEVVGRLAALETKRFDLVVAQHSAHHRFEAARGSVSTEEFDSLKEHLRAARKKVSILHEQLEEMPGEMKCCQADLE